MNNNIDNIADGSRDTRTTQQDNIFRIDTDNRSVNYNLEDDNCCIINFDVNTSSNSNILAIGTASNSNDNI